MLATAQDRAVSFSVAAPISTAQIRAARGLLKWTQAALAARAGLSAVTLNMIENDTVRPRERTLVAIRHALEAGGVRFLTEDGLGVGVRFAPAATADVATGLIDKG